MFITLSSTIHQIIMIAAIMLLLFLSIINPLVHGQEILNTVVEGKQVADNKEVTGFFSRIVGDGYDTTSAGGSNDDYAIAGGLHNAASDSIQRKLDNDDSGDQAFIGLGTNNVATGAKSVIGGGENNIANATHASIIGGLDNVASGYYSTVGGGDANVASGEGSTVSGGYGNVASEYRSTVGGGYGNVASIYYSTVSGGYGNVASGFDSAVGGGTVNKASGKKSTVGGGIFNTASGFASVIIGGSNNTASGEYSIAMGFNADAKKDRSLVINLNKKGDEVSSNKKGEFLVNSDSFTLQIGKKDVTIDKKNIQNFKNLLKNSADRRRHLDHINKDQQAIIEELHKQVNKFEARIAEQEERNNEQQEQINELHHMLIDFVGRSTE